MCGLAGIIIARKRRSRKELDALGETFTRLLLLSEHRGPHATGVAVVKRDGNCQVVKHPLPARHFVGMTEYTALFDTVDDQVTLLMGHTRWPTRGSAYNLLNNHPLVAGQTLTCHYAESAFMLSQHTNHEWLGLLQAIDQHIIFRLPVFRLDLFRASSDELAPLRIRW